MDVVEEIKGRLPVEDIVGRYVELKRSGASYKGLCPFHQEKTPSFYVTPSRGSYHCFGCGKGGDIFSFVMEHDRLPFPDALQRLADQAGVSLPERETRKPSYKGRLYEANSATAQFYAEALQTAQGEPARRYLQTRGFGSNAVEMFTLGFAPQGRNALVQHLRRAGFDDALLLQAGLAIQDDSGVALRDRFRGRLMFPIRDAAGKITGFGGRILGDGQPKYLNSPETEIFDKSATLFGIHRAQDALRSAGKVVLVEGYLDAVRAHVSGYSYTVASLGTAVTAKQLGTLSRLTETVIVALDPDPAGQSAAARTTLTALAEVTQARGRLQGQSGALDLRVATLPVNSGDPDELIREHPELWEQALDQSIPAFEFYFNRTLESLDRSGEGWRQEAIDRLQPLIQQFATSAGWQAVWTERLARETQIDPRFLQRSASGARPGQPGRPGGKPRDTRSRSKQESMGTIVADTTARAATHNPTVLVERSLLGLLLALMLVPDQARRQLEPDEMEQPEHRMILQYLLAWQSRGNYDYEMFRETLPEEVRAHADGLRGLAIPPPADGKLSVAIEFHLARLRRFRILAQLNRTRELLPDLDSSDQSTAIASLGTLNQRLLELQHQLEHLSQIILQAGPSTDQIAYAVTGRAPTAQGTIDHDSGRL